MGGFGRYLGVKSWYQFFTIDGEMVEAIFLSQRFLPMKRLPQPFFLVGVGAAESKRFPSAPPGSD